MEMREKNHLEDEMVDEELRKLGVRFTDRTREIPMDAEYRKADRATGKGRGRFEKASVARWQLQSLAALVAADAMLIFMCLTDKIEMPYGLVALAAASAMLGGRVKNARV